MTRGWLVSVQRPGKPEFLQVLSSLELTAQEAAERVVSSRQCFADLEPVTVQVRLVEIHGSGS